MFIDAAWLESRLLQWYAPQVRRSATQAVCQRFTRVMFPQSKTAGDATAIDGSALGRFLLERLNAAYPLDGYVLP